MRRVATIHVKSVWKGVERSVVQVETAIAGPVCGYDFIVGYDYLVYAQRSGNGILSTGLCSRTRVEYDARHEDLKVLGPGTSPRNIE